MPNFGRWGVTLHNMSENINITPSHDEGNDIKIKQNVILEV